MQAHAIFSPSSSRKTPIKINLRPRLIRARGFPFHERAAPPCGSIPEACSVNIEI